MTAYKLVFLFFGYFYRFVSSQVVQQQPQVTIFTSMGRFDPSDKPQVAAFTSWLKNSKEVIAFVDEQSQCSKLLAHFHDLRCIQHYCMHDEIKIPFVSCLLISAEAIAKTKFLMYTNADIIFSSLQPSVEILNNALPNFVDGKIIGMGQRTDLDLDEEAPFPPDLMQMAKQRGVLHPDYGIDYFLYTKGSLPIATMPQFLIGNSKWDNWLLSELLIRNASCVVDLTKTFLAVHVGLTEKSLTERKGYIYNEQLWKINRHATRYIGLGRVDFARFYTEGGALKSKSANLYEELIHNVNLLLHRSGFLYILSFSGDQLKLFENWLLWAKKINFKRFLVYALDDIALSIAKSHRLMVYSSLDCHLIHKKYVDRSSTPFRYPNVSMEEQWIVRNNFFLLLVKSGFSIMSIEVDTIFLSDPFVEISSGEIFTHLEGPASKVVSSSFFGISSKAQGKGEMFLRRLTKCLQQRFGKPLKKEGVSMLSSCVNDLYFEFKGNQLDIFKLLDLSIVADGRSFFEAHIPQSYSFTPAIIHVDHPAEYNQKLDLLRSWNLLLDANSPDSKSTLPISGSGNGTVKDLLVSIRIFAKDQPTHLQKLLKDLSAAVFDSAAVHIEFFINKPTDSQSSAAHAEVVKLANAFSWTKGSKTVTVETASVAANQLVLRPLKLRGSDPNVAEVLLILEEGCVLSPFFHKWAKSLLLRYADQQQSGLYGLALQRQRDILGLRKGEKHLGNDYLDTRIDPKASCYRYQLVTTNGQYFYASQWNRFVEWTDSNSKKAGFSPCVPYLVSNADDPKASWPIWFHKFAHQNGLYNLYLNYVKVNGTANLALALDKLEELRAAKSKKKAPQLQLLLKEPSLKLSPLKYYPLFDFYFSKISDAAIKENWRFTSNFASNPCVTNVKL